MASARDIEPMILYSSTNGWIISPTYEEGQYKFHYILEDFRKLACIFKDEIEKMCPNCLSKKETDRVANIATKISRLSEEEYNLLFQHGYEVADYTLYAYNADTFNYIGYENSHWG